MLDTIVYSKTDNRVMKTVTGICEVLNIQLEISAVRSQLESFYLGESNEEIVAAISNYETQLEFLQGL